MNSYKDDGFGRQWYSYIQVTLGRPGAESAVGAPNGLRWALDFGPETGRVEVHA